jgi:hypothetical protein
MAAIVGFLLVHVALALLVPQTLVAMVTGGPLMAGNPPAAPEPMPADPTPMATDATPTPDLPPAPHQEAAEAEPESGQPEEIRS